MKNYLKAPALLGLMSATAMLGACSMSQGSSTQWGHGGTYSAGYSGSAYTGAANTRTYYAPRIDAGYTGRATTVSRTAPYGSATRYGTTHYGGVGYGAAPRAAGYNYGSLGAVMYDVDQDAYGVQGRLGRQITPLLGVEGEASLGVIDEEQGGVDVGVDYQIAGFGTASLPLGRSLSVHARGGYHLTEVQASAGGLAVSSEEDGFAYGAGAALALSPRDSLRLDYTRYDSDAGDLDSVALAFQRRF
jgi:hypothetical protein